MKFDMRWLPGKTPEDLAKRFEHDALDPLKKRIAERMELVGVEAADSMKAGRPWRDISGNARRGLRTEVEVTKEEVILYLIHSVEYGVNLELGHAGRYAILVPEMARTIPRLRRALTGVI